MTLNVLDGSVTSEWYGQPLSQIRPKGLAADRGYTKSYERNMSSAVLYY